MTKWSAEAIEANKNSKSHKVCMDQQESRTVINVDRYGTKTIRIIEMCNICDGTGHLECFDYHENGICFQCWGSGYTERVEKEMTPEREAQVKAQSEKRFQKKFEKDVEKEQKRIAERFPEGKIWIVRNRNTFEIKDQIKADGGRFNLTHKWYFIHKVEGYILQEVDLKDAFENKWSALIDGGVIDIDRPKMVEGEVEKDPSEWIGSVGDKIEMDVILEDIRFYNTTSKFHYGEDYHTVYVFRDDQNNLLIWDTTTGFDNDLNKHSDKGVKIHLKGKIKDHSEYRGTKQTKLTRCKITRIEK